MSAMFTKRLAKANLKIGNYVVKEIKEKDKAKKKKAKELVSKSENRDLGKHRSVGSS